MKNILTPTNCLTGDRETRSPIYFIFMSTPIKSIQIQNEIKRLFKEDQNDRVQLRKENHSFKKFWAILKKNDEKRRATINKILSDKKIKLRGIDYFYIGVIFQHGGTTQTTAQAKQFAQKGIKLGHNKSKWLYAAATDRLLLMQKKKQKFGTQYQKNAEGQWKLMPVASGTTDAERKKYNVIPLQKAINMAELMTKKEQKTGYLKKIGLSRSK